MFARSIHVTQKRMIPKCSNLVYGMNLGHPTNDMVLGLKGQRSKVKVRVRVRVRIRVMVRAS